MALFGLVLATMIPVSVALVIAYWNWTVQRTFFESMVAARGHAPKATQPIRLGLGLDDMAVSWRDHEPMSRALNAPIDEAGLEAARQRARFARRVVLTSLPVVVAISFATVSVFATFWLVPVLGTLAAWALGWSAANQPGIWYSRPEFEPLGNSMWIYYLLPLAIVAGALLLAGLAIALGQALRG
jgi:hypothetical protein